MATRILIADDHEMMRAVLRNLINSHGGWEVCAEAKNGSEAVVQATDLHPDLIILDLAMPVMDGIRAAREISKRDPKARMIMFTLHASPEVEEQARRVGVKCVVSKAKNGSRLVLAIEETLGEGNGCGEHAEEEKVTDFEPQRLERGREIRVHQAGTTEASAERNAAASTVEAPHAATEISRNRTEGAQGLTQGSVRKRE